MDHTGYLLRLAELELLDRERRLIERRIRQGALPDGQEPGQLRLRCDPVAEQAAGAGARPRGVCRAAGERDRSRNSGTGKTHVALGLGLAACQKGLSVGFTTAAALVHELLEARDERRLLRLQKQLAGCKPLIIDELGYVPLSTTGAELLFEP